MEKRFTFGFVAQLFLLVLTQWDTVAGLDIKASVMNTTFIGVTKCTSTRGYASFLGIRYGEPPSGDKRFQKSSLYKYSEDNVEAKKFGNICPQLRKGNPLVSDSDSMDEDCLFMNIIVPLDCDKLGKTDQDISELVKGKAVYIFIHGGIFIIGSSNLYSNSEMVMKGDFIAVTLNYRLGLFGFLATDDNAIPANLGLWDQQLAIQWVKQNIAAFGGDISRITLGGHSAGSMSAILQGFYGGNKNIFQNMIAESGSPFAFHIISEKGYPAALKIAQLAGCNLTSTKSDESSKEILKCLKGRSVTDLAALTYSKRLLGPVLDNDFITKETFELCPQGIRNFAIPASISSNFANINLLTGFTTNDGEVVFMLALNDISNVLGVSNWESFVGKPVTHEFVRGMTNNLLLMNTMEDRIISPFILDAIMEYYRDWSKPSTNLTTVSMNGVDILTDIYFAKPAFNTALLHSVANTCRRLNSSNCGNMTRKTYLYEFRLPVSNPLAINSYFPWFHGTRHGAEILFLFDNPLKDRALPLTETIMTAWSNFINTGNPNSGQLNEWEDFNEESEAMFLMSDNSRTVKGTLAKRVHLWNEYIPKLHDKLRLVLQKEKPEPQKKRPDVGSTENGGVNAVQRKYSITITAIFIFASFISSVVL